MSKTIETQIISEWYDAMDAQNVTVPPMAATLLQSVLHEFKLQRADRDVWQEFLIKSFDELYAWYMSLTDDERGIIDRRRAELWRDCRQKNVEHNDTQKELLRG